MPAEIISPEYREQLSALRKVYRNKAGDADYLVSQTAGVADILPRVEKLLSNFS